MNIVRYDPEANAMYVRLSSRKAWETMEINHHVNVDLDRSGHVVSVELLDLRKFIENIFGKNLTEAKLKSVKIHARTESGSELILDMNYAGERAYYAIPQAYTSPLVASV